MKKLRSAASAAADGLLGKPLTDTECAIVNMLVAEKPVAEIMAATGLEIMDVYEARKTIFAKAGIPIAKVWPNANRELIKALRRSHGSDGRLVLSPQTEEPAPAPPSA